MTKKQDIIHKTTIPLFICSLFLFFSCESEQEEKKGPVPSNELSLQKVVLAFESTDRLDKTLPRKSELENLLSVKLQRAVETRIAPDPSELYESLRTGKIDLAYLNPRDAVPIIDQKVASAFLVRLSGDNPDKSIWICRKDKNYADISEAKGKAIAFAKRKSDPGCLIPIGDLKSRDLIGSDRALTDFFSQVLYGDKFETIIEKVLNGEVEATAAGYHEFEKLSEKLKSQVRIFQELGTVPTEVLCIRSSMSASDQAIIEQAFSQTNEENPEQIQRAFRGTLVDPEKEHLEIIRGALQAITEIKP
ncbi:MAG: hypothetical protein CMI29_03540 [Opitutae bacterium]|nr:hypothetical protein [Opitutae bacterium]